MTPEAACSWIETHGVVPVVRARTANDARRAVEALRAGGISVFEITLTVPNAFDVIRSLSRDYRDQVLVGAGTVLSPADARRSIEAGAQFVVSPGFDPAIVAAVRELGRAIMPGALTPTEVLGAWNAGAHVVKVFPCSALGGAPYLQALRGPFPDIKLMPTGGVDASTAAAYIKAGACALGVGGKLVDQSALDAGRDEL
ncbi:MAG TPA: bifunctional 4-hydroxy-2-oxoglutarate aldolase/2-dehydro-3-deoxy-phosphogluconate aldolase, partial [Polyangiaceae bacterium]|nr:bifunctional 4-hydroxy-2-oxoglutarate aldolase/2-dehydro-3-deoxy-phosphogluconate aldolase [Polyangiaceae bacterium]